MLTQEQPDGKLHPIAYASRALAPAEKNYGITDLETLAVVWAMSHFHYYLYGHQVTVYTDHSAARAVLEAPNPTGKHAKWWLRVHGKGVKEVRFVYHSGRENSNADALSRCLKPPDTEEAGEQDEVQIAAITVPKSPTSKKDIHSLLGSEVTADVDEGVDLAMEQKKDSKLNEMINYLEEVELPSDEKRARQIAAQASLFALDGSILSYIDKAKGCRKVALPEHLRKDVMEQAHSGPCGGHFSGNRLLATLAHKWYWDGMYMDTVQFCKSCPQCTIVSGAGRSSRPPLHPTPVQRPLQIVGVDVMDLPVTEQGNRHVVVFQDFFTKWSLVFRVPDQKAIRLVKLLTEEVIPFFGVPEALLSDRVANLLSYLMKDVCALLGIKKLNTTACHPQCDGMVERFYRTLKTTLRKLADKFGYQWDRYLPGVLWAYRNTPHESAGEKPSFLPFGMDCRSPPNTPNTCLLYTSDAADE